MTRPIATATKPPVTSPPAAERGDIEITYRDVTKRFEDGDSEFVAVESIDLDVTRGSFVSIIGPSGCGKSTLLNMAAGLMEPSSGDVLYDGRPVRGVNRSVGYVTQHSSLVPWRTVERNVGLALELSGVDRHQRRQRVDEMLRRVGLEAFAKRYPAQLSGGMQRRVALARTFIYEPRTLLMDEPFGALDAQTRLVLQRQLLDLWQRDQRTVLFVTHDLEEAILLSDYVVVFGTKPGRIIHVEEVPFARPRDLIHLRGEPSFSAIWERLWRLLEPQLAR